MMCVFSGCCSVLWPTRFLMISCEDRWFLALHSLQRMGWMSVPTNLVISGSLIASCEAVALWLRAMELLQDPSVIGGVASRCFKFAH